MSWACEILYLLAHGSFQSPNHLIIVPTRYKRHPVRTHVQKNSPRPNGEREGVGRKKEWIQHILTKIHREHTCSKYRNGENGRNGEDGNGRRDHMRGIKSDVG